MKHSNKRRSGEAAGLIENRSGWLAANQLVASGCVALLLTFACGCRKEPAGASKGGGPPPTEVSVVKPTEMKIIDYREYTGRTAAVDSVEVRSRVSGYILETPRKKKGDGAANEHVNVTEGSVVKEGDLLFLIDPEPYELAIKQATASIAAMQATLTRNEKDYARLSQLRDTNSISQAEVDSAFAARDESKAQVDNLKAARDRAELDLRFTKVISPINGLVGEALVTRGNLVVADSTILTSIVSTDPVYVYFDVDEESLLDYRRRIRTGAVQSARNSQIDISMALTNETEFTHQGYIDFVDNKTDPDTGNTRIRGTFPNADNSLSPGLFARVKIPFTAEYPALLVPTRSLGMDQQGRFLMVVDEKSTAKRRAVEVGSEREGMTVITKGLTADDVVIVEGLQKARPGAPVTTVPYVEAVATGKKADAVGAAP